MSDSFTEVSTQGWFSRIGGAFKGIIVGLVLFVIAFPVLFLNEGRAVKRTKTLNEGGSAVVSVAADTVEPGNEGKLVHMSAKAMTEDILNDDQFGISVNALKLKRVVEMYQWKQSEDSKTEKKVGGKTKTTKTYSYAKVWSSKVISSSNFKVMEGHQNPGSMQYASTEKIAEKVILGAFRLSPSLVSMINNYTPVTVDEGTLPEMMKGKVKVSGGGYYSGANPGSPVIGDERVTFKAALPTEISVVANQVKDTFEPFYAEAGGSIELLEIGVASAEAMFQAAHASNTTLTWILRLVGFLVMFFGLLLIFKPLSVLADVLPILGTIVGAGTGFIAFLIAAVLSVITIAIAWIVYRPLLGIALLVVAAALIYLIFTRFKKAKAKAPAPAAA